MGGADLALAPATPVASTATPAAGLAAAPAASGASTADPDADPSAVERSSPARPGVRDLVSQFEAMQRQAQVCEQRRLSRAEDAQERRQARDGGWYTQQELEQSYNKSHDICSVWRWIWEQVVRQDVGPGASQPGSSERAGLTALDAAALPSQPAPALATHGASLPR
ncbi:hypothetical protein N9L68_06675 [bacterium]|nr:hypothetical protein [bacterium]